MVDSLKFAVENRKMAFFYSCIGMRYHEQTGADIGSASQLIQQAWATAQPVIYSNILYALYMYIIYNFG